MGTCYRPPYSPIIFPNIRVVKTVEDIPETPKEPGPETTKRVSYPYWRKCVGLNRPMYSDYLSRVLCKEKLQILLSQAKKILEGKEFDGIAVSRTGEEKNEG